MARFSIHAFLEDESDLTLACDVASSLGLSVTKQKGSKQDVIIESRKWIVQPQILLIDLSSEQDIVAGLEEIAESGPEIDVNVIVVGDRDDVRLSRKLLSMGVVDYLLKPLSRDDLVEAFTRAMQNGENRSSTIDPKRLITVTGACGGAGSSILTATIANHYAEQGFKTLVVDLDFISGTQFALNGGKHSEGFRSAIQEPARVDNVFLTQLVVRTGKNGNLFILSDPGPIDIVPDVASLTQFFALLTSAFDIVVVDLPRYAEFAKPILAASSRIFCVTLPSISGVKNALKFSNNEARSLISDSLVFIVNDVNGAKSSAIKLSEFSSRIDKPILALPHDPVVTYREEFGEDVDLKKGKLKKNIIRILDVLPKVSSKKQISTTNTQSKSVFVNILNWLKT